MLEDLKKTTDPFGTSNLVVIGYAEFVRRMTKEAGGEGYWEHSDEKHMQVRQVSYDMEIGPGQQEDPGVWPLGTGVHLRSLDVV